jgi:hypothetical protein
VEYLDGWEEGELGIVVYLLLTVPLELLLPEGVDDIALFVVRGVFRQRNLPKFFAVLRVPLSLFE